MLSIGDFARHGQVSVRMLRHYDQLGLLVPDRVDPVSGYRFYEVGQLAPNTGWVELPKPAQIWFAIGRRDLLCHPCFEPFTSSSYRSTGPAPFMIYRKDAACLLDILGNLVTGERPVAVSVSTWSTQWFLDGRTPLPVWR